MSRQTFRNVIKIILAINIGCAVGNILLSFKFPDVSYPVLATLSILAIIAGFISLKMLKESHETDGTGDDTNNK